MKLNLPIHSKFCQVGRVERQSWVRPILGCERESKITMEVKMVKVGMVKVFMVRVYMVIVYMVKVYMVKVYVVKVNLVVVIPDGSSSQR